MNIIFKYIHRFRFYKPNPILEIIAFVPINIVLYFSYNYKIENLYCNKQISIFG